MDVIVYAGEIERAGYEAISDICEKPTSSRVLLALSTYGGDPHAGFRIGRALQHTYDKVAVLVPCECKSAGTLVCISANTLFMDDRSELGPLDIQMRKGDELFQYGSGLDFLQSLSHMQIRAMEHFRTFLVELTGGAGLSTKLGAEIASNLTTGLFGPVYGQIDPVRLGEMQRALEIAHSYGRLLDERADNLKVGGLAKLVTGYCSHSFVIDRREARSIFKNVNPPEQWMHELCQFVRGLGAAPREPIVEKVDSAATEGGQNAGSVQTSNTEGSAGQSAAVEPEIDGDRSKHLPTDPSSDRAEAPGANRGEDPEAGATDLALNRLKNGRLRRS